jgi:hypothetical protein
MVIKKKQHDEKMKYLPVKPARIEDLKKRKMNLTNGDKEETK